MKILTINAGSSSIKYKVFEEKVGADTHSLLLSGLIEGIGESAGSWSHQLYSKNKASEKDNQTFTNHQMAFNALSKRLKRDLGAAIIHGVGHRVVHGGNQYFKPTPITGQVLEDIKALAKLAPLHNPINAAGIEFALEYFNEAHQLAIFDTGFHHSMPSFVSRYAIDSDFADKYQIQRYGFHGINHEYVSLKAAEFLNKPITDCNFITLHLGNGASACLIKNGLSFDTSMGMTPLAGLIMGTRCGDIDPAIPLYCMQQGLTHSAIDTLLNKQSGLKGIAKDNDMRNLLSRMEKGDAEANLAIDMYTYVIQKTIGAYLSQVNNLDALIFTGGIGENAAFIRQKIVMPLQHFGFILDEALNEGLKAQACKRISKGEQNILVVPGDEEALIAETVANYISGIHNATK